MRSDTLRTITTVAIWIAVAAILMTLKINGSPDMAVQIMVGMTAFLSIGAAASTFAIWRSAGQSDPKNRHPECLTGLEFSEGCTDSTGIANQGRAGVGSGRPCSSASSRGGQTGADQGGLRAARACGIPTGGWAPRGWQTEDGPCPALANFGLVEIQGRVSRADPGQRPRLGCDDLVREPREPRGTDDAPGLHRVREAGLPGHRGPDSDPRTWWPGSRPM